MTKIRSVRPSDLPALETVIDGTELFPADMLEEMTEGYFDNDEDGGTWLTCEENGEAVAVAAYAAEPMTEGTFNAFLLAVHPEYQGQGVGAALMLHIEQTLRDQEQRVLLVETSGLPTFKRTRAFYRKIGYEEEARIREFYAAGEDKVVFRKAL